MDYIDIKEDAKVYAHTSIGDRLLLKYAWQDFTSLRLAVSEWVWQTLTVVGTLFCGTYFAAQWFIFLLNHSN